MRSPEHDEGRPRQEAPSQVVTNDRTSSVDRTGDGLADLDALAANLAGYFVVQVVINDRGTRRTFFYRSAAAAERAVERARGRGRHAHVTLCQLHPVGVVTSLPALPREVVA